MGMQSAIAVEALSAVEELTMLPIEEENPYNREWRQNGGSVFGYTCNCDPEGILHAIAVPAEILLIRLAA